MKKPDPRRFPEIGKELGKMLLQAVIFGVGVELGKDVYCWVRGRNHGETGVVPDQDTDDPDGGDNASN